MKKIRYYLFAVILIAQMQRAFAALTSPDGDFKPGVIARDGSARLWYYPGNAAGGFLSPIQIGQGWGGMNSIVGVSDFSGDGHSDLVAREAATGKLWLYRGDGTGHLQAGIVVGTGWDGMTVIIGPGDFDGDKHADILAVDGSGQLWLYPGNGAGGFLAPRAVSADLSGINYLLAAGDIDNDGNPDLLGRDSAGTLWFYRGDGHGGISERSVIGNGWNIMDAIIGVGDFNGDGYIDLLAREPSTGKLWLYPGQGGAFGSRVIAGTGWNGMNAILSAQVAGSVSGGMGSATYVRNGFTLAFVSKTSLLPTTTANNLIRAYFLGIAAESARYNSSVIHSDTMTVDPAYKGVAYAAGTSIVISATWMIDHPQDYDLVTHEVMHLVQAYTTPVPGYWVEGLADYARYIYGLNDAVDGWTLQDYTPAQKYTDGYGVTARFLLWLSIHVKATTTDDLNRALKAGTYTDQFWVTETGKTVTQLWAMYGAAPDL